MKTFDDKREDIVMTEVLRELLFICGFDTPFAVGIYYPISLEIKGKIKVFLSGVELEVFCKKLIDCELITQLTNDKKLDEIFNPDGTLSSNGQSLLNGLYMSIEDSIDKGYSDRASGEDLFKAVENALNHRGEMIKNDSIENVKNSLARTAKFVDDFVEFSEKCDTQNNNEKSVQTKKENYYNATVFGYLFLLCGPFVFIFIIGIFAVIIDSMY